MLWKLSIVLRQSSHNYSISGMVPTTNVDNMDKKMDGACFIHKSMGEENENELCEVGLPVRRNFNFVS